MGSFPIIESEAIRTKSQSGLDMTVGQIARDIQTRRCGRRGESHESIDRESADSRYVERWGTKDQRVKMDPESRTVVRSKKSGESGAFASRNGPCHSLTLGMAGKQLPACSTGAKEPV
jgi:hypothetical protein